MDIQISSLSHFLHFDIFLFNFPGPENSAVLSRTIGIAQRNVKTNSNEGLSLPVVGFWVY